MRLPSSNRRMSSSRSIRPFAAAIAAIGIAAFFFDPSLSFAQEKPACEQMSWTVKRELALFAAPDLRTVPSGTSLDSLPDKGVALQLEPDAAVPFVLPPERKATSVEGSGGLIAVKDVPRAGTYQVTLSTDAWIDVIQNGKAVPSVAHTGKRDCMGVRKSVRFELQPGPVTLQLSGAPVKLIKLAILPAE